MALVLHERANGADIAPNYVAQPTEFLYRAQTSTSNNLGDSQNPMYWLEFNDTAPVDYPRVSNPPTPPETVRTGSNVYKAWQFVIAHGFRYRPKIAIIDGGFGVD